MGVSYNDVNNVRQEFIDLKAFNVVRDNGTIEITGLSFIADQPSIFGEPNKDYIKAELAWYEGYKQGDDYTTTVDALADIYGKRVKIWDDVSGDYGDVNSHYGCCIYRDSIVMGDRSQYDCALEALRKDQTTRQAVMYYTPPYIHQTATESGKNDHICTTSVQYLITDIIYNQPKLEAVVNMRSNDAIFGYANDLAWQRHVLYKLAQDLYWHYPNITPGKITWNAGSFHVYERHWDLIK